MDYGRAPPDPDQVHTPAELANALDVLRAQRSYRDLDRAARALPPEEGGPARLPTSTLGDLLNKGRARSETLEVFLAACVIPRDQASRWRAAWERTRLISGQPAGAVRVRDAVARQLGVHKPIHVSGANPDTLPTYVPRDVDLDTEAGVRARIDAASKGGGGFVLLVGESSVGKTRTLFEAIQELLPDWWLLQPDPHQLTELAADPPARLVVWLDELQNHLGGEKHLPVAAVRALLRGGVVLVATLWPFYYDLYTVPRSAPSGVESHDERELLKLADTIHMAPTFTFDETQRAQAAADGDTRLRVALQSADFGLTQTIAAAPQLVSRWNNADPYAKAVLTVAADAARLGVQTPIPADLLRAAAPGYCSPIERVRASADWFERALAYATQPLLGATSALIPIAEEADMTMGTSKTYRIADYLLQFANKHRESLCPPATFWDACIEHLTYAHDQMHVGSHAYTRLRYCYALPLLRRAADAGDSEAAQILGWILAGHGETDEAIMVLQPHVEKSTFVADRLATLLVSLGKEDEAIAVLEARAAQPDEDGRTAAEWTFMKGDIDQAISILRRHATHRMPRGDVVVMVPPHTDDVEELQARFESGNQDVVSQLATELAEQGKVDDTINVLQIDLRRRGGFSTMPHLYAELLTKQGRVDEAIIVLRNQLNFGRVLGPEDLAGHLAELLVSQGKTDDAERLVRLGLTADGQIIARS